MTKTATYKALLEEVGLHIEGEHDETAVLANVSALLHAALGRWWTGFYRVQALEGIAAAEGGRTADDAGEQPGEQLVLGPFQGPAACYRIAKGRGVCGTAWAERRTLLVPDVHQFPGHIACSAASRSEIVVPLADGEGRVRAVLDIDSSRIDDFDETDRHGLEQLARLVARHLYGGAEKNR